MNEKSQKCFNCRYFKRYYLKEVKEFKKTNYGLCYKNGGTVEYCDECENFTFKTRTVRDERAVKECLNGLLTELSAIRQIIEEERDDQKL